MDNNLVLTISFNYSLDKIRPFVESLRQFYSGSVVVVTNNLDSAMSEYFEKQNIISYQVNDKFPMNLIYFIRWQYYKNVIEDHFPDVEKIIISDIRDVVFQDDPFSRLTDNAINWSIDPEKLGNCLEHNGKWVRDIYGEEEFEKAKDQWILCAGLLGGTRQGILDVSNAMIKEAEELSKINKLTFADQGSLNVLYSRGLFPDSVINDHFRTMHHSKKLLFDRQGYLINDAGERVAVVHCYDRLGLLNTAFIRNAFQLKGREGVKRAADYVISNFHEWDLG